MTKLFLSFFHAIELGPLVWRGGLAKRLKQDAVCGGGGGGGLHFQDTKVCSN